MASGTDHLLAKHAEEEIEEYTDEEELKDTGNASVSDEDTSDEDEDDTGMVTIDVDPPVWSGQQLLILCPMKDRWFEGDVEEQKTIIKEAVKELLKLQPQDKTILERKVTRWLKRKTSKRKRYGPGIRPTFQTVVGYYMDAELTNAVYQDHGVQPGDKSKRFVGLYKTALAKLMHDIRDNPKRSKDWAKMEEARTKWMRNGPPPDRKRK